MGAAKSTLVLSSSRPFTLSSRHFCEKPAMAQTLPQDGLVGPAKLKSVTDLMDMLTQDLDKTKMQPQQRDEALDKLKVYGRDPRDADPIFTKEGIETLTRHAFNSSSATTSRNALRCLANAMLIKPETRQIFVDLDYTAKACNKLRSGSIDDEFLVSRIIFLTTYGTNVHLPTLIDQYRLADAITQNLVRHAKLYTPSRSAGASSSATTTATASTASTASTAKTKGKATSISLSSPSPASAAAADPMIDMALTETAKLLFNVTHFCKDRASAFTPAIGPIVAMICKHDVPQPHPLDPPLGSLVNALLILDLESKEGHAALFSTTAAAGSGEAPQTALANRLVQLLDLSLAKYADAELDQVVLPLVTALRNLYSLAPAEVVRPFLQAKLLPTAADRKNVLGRGASLSAKLLRHTTNAMAPEFRSAVSHLLFELSDKDAGKLVQNIGYGFSSGFLFQNNIPLPQSAADALKGGLGGGEGSDGDRPINAVTGQFLDEETGPDLPDMTDEEKEREAERLFVLFERLRRTGVVDIENPVVQALREGRLEKIDDSDRIEELD